MSANPLDFWKLNSKELPTLAILARKYLGPRPSSSTSEREFKIGKNMQKDRIRLLPSNVETLLFLKYNLHGPPKTWQHNLILKLNIFNCML